MLKFTYTETGLFIERLDQSLEELISRRILLAIRLGQPLIVEPGTATFLLPFGKTPWKWLEDLTDTISLCFCDEDSVEVSLKGTWIAQDLDRAEGIFLSEMSDRTETILLKLWHDACVGDSVSRQHKF
jgi:hypothetical protein